MRTMTHADRANLIVAKLPDSMFRAISHRNARQKFVEILTDAFEQVEREARVAQATQGAVEAADK